MLHMDKQEVMNTRYGEMMDMISCFSIYRGAAKQARRKKKLTYEEIIKLR